MEKISIGGTEFPVSKQTLDALSKGIVTKELDHKLRQIKGEEFTYDYSRQVRLQKKVLDQIEEGQLPVHLLPLVRTGRIPTEILHPLHTLKLVPKSEYLYKKNYLSKEAYDEICNQLLTETVIAPLSKALLLDVADYLYSKEEISKGTLEGFRNGTIDLSFIKVIRRHHRKMQHHMEQDQKHLSLPSDAEHEYRGDYLNNLPASQTGSVDSEPEIYLLRHHRTKTLDQAMEWLSPEEYSLIDRIYYGRESICSIARSMKLSEGAIRYHQRETLKKLRFILETLMNEDLDTLL